MRFVSLWLGAVGCFGAGCNTDAPLNEPWDPASAHDVDRHYRFVDEAARDESGNSLQRTVGDEMRVALWGESDGEGRWVHQSAPLRLPDHARFSSGIGAQAVGENVSTVTTKFVVQIETPDADNDLSATYELGASRVKTAQWQDVSLDLSAFANRIVRFTFMIDTDASGEPAAFWGNPKVTAENPSNIPRSPNVILISLDTLRADHLGIYGYDRPTSPHLDAFGRDAIVFDRAISPSSWTLPAHASIFTGESPSEHGATFMGADAFVGETLAEIAYAAGYRTGALTDGGFVRGNLGFSQGFESYLSDRKPAAKRFEEALRWIDRLQGEPFFLFLHTYQIHTPYRPPQQYAERFLRDQRPADEVIHAIDTVEKNREIGPVHRQSVVDLYDAEIAYTDDAVHSFFEGVKQRSLWDNTLIVVFSDHGEQFWEHGRFGHGLTLFEEEIRVALIVKPAGTNFSPGRKSQLVSLTDLYATITTGLDWSHDQVIESVSFWHLLETAQESRPERKAVISEVGLRATSWDPLGPGPRAFAYRAPIWKVILNERASNAEYYDLASDPREVDNRSSEAPELVRNALVELEEYRKRSDLFRSSDQLPKTSAPHLTDSDREELEALGYFQ